MEFLVVYLVVFVNGWGVSVFSGLVGGILLLMMVFVECYGVMVLWYGWLFLVEGCVYLEVYFIG